MFRDEAYFHLNEYIKRYNTLYWAPNNPHVTADYRRQTNTKVTVWCPIHGNTLLQPGFLAGGVKAERYLQLLNVVLEPYVVEMPFAALRRFALSKMEHHLISLAR
jgi:hypothetical protein